MVRLKNYLSLVKFSHTVFAMPFAMIGYFAGVLDGGFSLLTFVLVLLCMVFARNSSMAFNRLVDRRFDGANPRTSSREIPLGLISVRSTVVFTIINIVFFVVCSGLINNSCLLLSPLAMVIVLGYSYTKRFTSFCHLILGLGLAISPVGAYLAVTGTTTAMIWTVALLVWSWVSGFDIIFALQDVDFARSAGLHSIPALLGVRNGLIVSALLHFVTVASIVLLGVLYLDIWLYWFGSAIFVGLLFFQHIIVKPSDLSRVNLAFGTSNGLASVVYAIFTIAALFVVQ